MNLPNLLTLSRIPLLFGIAALLMLSSGEDPVKGASTGALVLFIVGALTDWADGYVARKQGLVSNFGKLMDALTDKVFMVGLFIALLVLDVLPQQWDYKGWGLFLLLLMLSREFLITGLRLVAASSGIVLAAEKSGKHKTVSQIIAAALLLSTIALQNDFSSCIPPVVGECFHLAGLLFFILATVLTVSSGTSYMIKYWTVFSGQESDNDN